MTQEKKYTKTCGRYHFTTVKICKETDIVMTKCRVCGELKPSTLSYFVKDSHKDADRLIQPLCKKCNNILQKQYQAKYREKAKNEKQISPTNVKEEALFTEDESIESKIDKIFTFLGLNKGTTKKS